MSEKDRKFTMDFIDRTTFIADAKKYLEEGDLEMEIPNAKQKLKKQKKYLLTKMKKCLMHQ